MSVRTGTVMNTLADAVVAALNRINATLDAGQWLTTPSVRRGLSINVLAPNVPRPALLVSAGDGAWEDATDVGGWGLHRKRVDIKVYCLSEGGPGDGDAETALCNLVSDAEKALTDDETLGGLSKIELPRMSYAGDVVAMNATGLAVGVITYTAVIEWVHGAP